VAANFRVINKLFRYARSQDTSFGHNVRSVGDAEGFPHIVIGDKNADTSLFQVENYLPDVIYCKGINTREWFVEQNKFRVARETSGDLDTTTFAAGKTIAANTPNV
jgi:hypothetical protein